MGHMYRSVSAFLAKLREKGRKKVFAGFTLVELLTVIAILGTVAGIAVPTYSRYINKARITKAISDIALIQKEIKLFEIDQYTLPNTLDAIGRGNYLDPYGNPYQYQSFAAWGGKGVAGKRRDKWDKPLNDDFDLYSMGRDGQSQDNLNAKLSHDDIVRAREGRFIGLAAEF